MNIGFRIDSVSFSDGSTLELEQGCIVVIVGPNNSGKSACLRAIRDKIQNNANPSPVVSSVKTNRSASLDELTDWIKATSYCSTQKNSPGNTLYTSGGTSLWQSNLAHLWNNQNDSLGDLVKWFCRMLSAEDRITASNPADRIPLLRAASTHPIHELERDDRVESRVSAYFRKAFGVDLIVHRGAGSEVPLVVGERPIPKTGQDRLSFEYLNELEKLPRIQHQGDGMRSFAGVLLNTSVGSEPVVLIDEPEAFLHPPQAFLLGRMLTEERQTSRQLFVATHSTDVLRGILSAGGDAVLVVRILRCGDVNPVRLLNNSRIRELWGDPILRHTNIFDGLFHEKVVICEADGDCRFYSAVADAVSSGTHDRHSALNVMFTHCGGKARLATVARALRSVNVPIVIVADFDVLSDDEPLRSIVLAVGGDWASIEPSWRMVKTVVESRKTEASTRYVKAEVGRILDSLCVEVFPRSARVEIEKVIRRTSPWSLAKEVGSAFVPNGSPRESLGHLLATLRGMGVFVVEQGELECFVPTIGGHGPSWVNEALKRDLGTDPELESARSFVRQFMFGDRTT